MKKNQGIELLRIISMIYVMILHCMGKGGVLANATDRNVLYYSDQRLYIFLDTKITLIL